MTIVLDYRRYRVWRGCCGALVGDEPITVISDYLTREPTVTDRDTNLRAPTLQRGEKKDSDSVRYSESRLLVYSLKPYIKFKRPKRQGQVY